MQTWIQRGFDLIRTQLRRHGPPPLPRHMKLAPQPPEGLFKKFVAGPVVSLGYTLKDVGQPFQKPVSINVYGWRILGPVPAHPPKDAELIQSNPFNAQVDLDGSLTTGVNLTNSAPGTFGLFITAANAYGETVCITPEFVTVVVP